MKYFANAVILAAAIGLAQGLNCWVCEGTEGERGACNGENEKDKECAEQDQGLIFYPFRRSAVKCRYV